MKSYLNRTLGYITKSLADFRKEIWDIKYPVCIVGGAVLFLFAHDSWIDYSKRSRVISNIETIRVCSDLNKDGNIDNSEKMRALIEAFPGADRIIQERVRAASRMTERIGGYGALNSYYSNLVDQEFSNFLDGNGSDMFPLTRIEREQVLSKVAESLAEGNRFKYP